MQDGSTLYRYDGTATLTNFSLTDTNIQAANQSTAGSFVAIGGQGGKTYQYMGSPAGTSIDLANTDAYTNPVLEARHHQRCSRGCRRPRRLAAPTYTALGSTPANFSNSQTLKNGDTVSVDEGYDAPTYTVGSSNPASTTLKKGDVIKDGDTLYRYDARRWLRFTNGLSITGDTTDFWKIGGDAGVTYNSWGADGT